MEGPNPLHTGPYAGTLAYLTDLVGEVGQWGQWLVCRDLLGRTKGDEVAPIPAYNALRAFFETLVVCIHPVLGVQRVKQGPATPLTVDDFLRESWELLSELAADLWAGLLRTLEGPKQLLHFLLVGGPAPFIDEALPLLRSSATTY